MQKKPKKKIQPVYKPYLKGIPRDTQTVRRASSVLGLIAISMFIYLIAGSVLVNGNILIRAVLSLVFVAMFVSLAYSNGMNTGFQDVTFAEIAYQRRENGKTLDESEAAKCYHPAKGLVNALMGVTPFFLLAVVLAVSAQPQFFIRSSLPVWVSALERRTEVGAALQFYHQSVPWSIVDIIRMIVRLAIMPFITLAGSDNVWQTVWVERLSPLLVLIIPLGYAAGYLRGPDARAKMHAGIAANVRRRRKREKKRLEQKRKEPEQLV
jgi:hypothetical protein